ncbi:Molybdopterin oxidoreductase [Marinomonas sp. MED121]|uniref:nitrate reductase n=1 Tax=Marinomonas sp. MED121 TaxID=314277 RepID=UPI000068FE97|nr:nitrate reductase [Marinomonas sp. MED121]EAQ66839.1 Molybdopterin oxidoreductase [Marinomonas sp. MED121]
MPAKEMKTTCPYCGVGCGLKLSTDINEQGECLPVSGDETHPANFGSLCVKGSNLSQTLVPDGRLLTPYVDGKETDWHTAVDEAAERIKAIVAKHGPDTFAFYLSGQILTEDYYVANKLAKGFIGTANVDTNSRLCMASAVVGYKRAFGSDTVPCNYEDLETCDLLIMVGSNAAWTHPVLYQRIVAAKKLRPWMKVVVIDPRKTATCDIADLHLAITPGSDAAIFSYLLVASADTKHLDTAYIDQFTNGFEGCIANARKVTPDLKSTAEFCGIAADDLELLVQLWCSKEKTVSFYSQGVNQSATGVDKSNAIINCHLATGRLGKEGMGPFSITGQPNAMGGREVGGLANQLAAHMDFATPGAIDLVKDFWQAPNMAKENGLKAVDLFKQMEEGKVKVVWIMSTNPMVSLPDTAQVQSALEACDLVIVSDIQASTDTSKFADILLPATGWSEKDGTVTNSERCISRQRGILPAPGEARHDWQAICDLAKALGFASGFSYRAPHEIFAEHAALSCFKNNGKRDFDIGHFSQINQQEYDALLPVQWPVPKGRPEGTKRMLTDGRFYTPNKKANFISITPQKPVLKVTQDFPYLLNTGRIRDQWHTMTRTGKTDKLSRHIDQPYLAISPKDAQTLNLVEKQVVSVANELGRLFLRVKISEDQKQGQVFAPIHWTAAYASNAVVSRLVQPVVDPLSGQPESKIGRVNIESKTDLTYGFVILNQDLKSAVFDEKAMEYWCQIPLKQGIRYELAFSGQHNLAAMARELLTKTAIDAHQGQWLEYENPINQSKRYAYLIDDVVQAVFYFSPNCELVDTAWLVDLVESASKVTAQERSAILVGRLANIEDKGSLICSCFDVGEKQIRLAIKAGDTDLVSLGKRLKCGTNCGSCVPEINACLIADSLAVTSE